jgi:hypothetical protein
MPQTVVQFVVQYILVLKTFMECVYIRWTLLSSYALACSFSSYLIEEMMTKHAELEGFSESVAAANGVIRISGSGNKDDEPSSRCRC